MKVGLFGGTFNPIHLGHLRSAEEVRAAFALDRIYFIPSAAPPHKRETDIAPAQHRYNMVERAVADNPAFLASRIELDRSGPSFSVDTIRTFQDRGTYTSLAFLIGMDAFCEIDSWHAYLEIPSLCDLIVTSRPGVPTPSIDQLLPRCSSVRLLVRSGQAEIPARIRAHVDAVYTERSPYFGLRDT